ncbi:MAG: nucleotidyltransferase family protein [Anaerolineaceae bacterium]|nr:nucleotidyltransferase family protein [Anaerolineaceae bacterium]
MDVILLAGGILNEKEPLFNLLPHQPKAMIPIDGRPLCAYALSSINAANAVDRIVIVGLPENAGLLRGKVAAMLPDQGGLIENVQSAGKWLLDHGADSSDMVMIAAADIPALKSSMVDWYAAKIERLDADLFYTIVSQRVMDRRYPGANRSYLPLRDESYCGGDLNAVRLEMIAGGHPLWGKLVSARKSVFRQAAMMGFDLLFLLLLRRLTLEEAIRRVCERLDIYGMAIISPYAEMAMDVDKPHQLSILVDDLRKEGLG